MNPESEIHTQVDEDAESGRRLCSLFDLTLGFWIWIRGYPNLRFLKAVSQARENARGKYCRIDFRNGRDIFFD